MKNIILEPREIYNTDWATILFIICAVLIATNRQLFYTQFREFLRLPINDKYLKIYKDPEHLNSWFFYSLYIVQIISFSFIIQLALVNYGYTTKDNFVSFIRIITVLNFFILSKHFCEKIIASTFEINEYKDSISLYKSYHRIYLGLISLPFVIFLYYNKTCELKIINILIVILILMNVIYYLNGIKNYKKVILSNFFYFILYLCALEIAPYFFMYYFFTKS